MEEANLSGWNAIDQAMADLYGKQEPKHYGTFISYALGGEDPLEGISAYQSEDPIPHWHFVTYGFSELYEKESEIEEESGYGFELTFRLPRGADAEEPPAWALNLLQNMGRYVFNSGNIFKEGDYLDANGPICLGADTQLTALAFIEDPELGMIDTPNGKVQFLQMVGITHDELEAMQTWNTLGVLAAGLPFMPKYITDLERDTLLSYDEVTEIVRIGMERDGSNTGILYVDQLGWELGKRKWFSQTPSVIQIGAKQAEIIGELLKGRILKGKSLTLAGPDLQIVFERGEEVQIVNELNAVIIYLNDHAVVELCDRLRPVQEKFSVPSIKEVTFQIVQTKITDHEGNVVQVIG